jgi:ADP-ribose pyrophosphatase YjhB (NUDIX family)
MSFLIRKSDKGDKRISSLMPLVDVAVVIAEKGQRLLAVFNEKWGAFTLPMSKRRSWEAPSKDQGESRREAWEDAAMRAAAEWTGRTSTRKPELILDLAEFQQSDRDGQWKRYHLQAFRIAVDDDFKLPAGSTAEWLTADDLLDEQRRPISPTARHIVAELRLEGKL